jgi:hypothetical protein
MLAKKVDTLHKAKEVEAKKKRQEIAALEKKFAAVCLEQERLGNLRGPGTSQTVSGRYALGNVLYKNIFIRLYIY